MDPLLLELAKARAAARDRREPYIRISKELLAEVVARLMDADAKPAKHAKAHAPKDEKATGGPGL